MKLQRLKNIPLRYKFVAIALTGMLMIALTMGIANSILSAEAESRYNAEQLSTQEALWQGIINAQFEQLEMRTASLRKDQQVSSALSNQDDELIIERAEDIYEQLSASKILHDLQVTNVKGLVKYHSGEKVRFDKNKMQVVKTALSSKKISKDIEIGSNGDLNSIVAFPLFSGGELVGAGVFIQSLQKAVEYFSEKNRFDTFIVSPTGELLHNTNPSLFKKLNLNLKSINERAVSNVKINKQYYSVAESPINNKNNQAIAHIVTARNITDSYVSSRNTQWVIYISIAIGILLITTLFSYYILYSLKPLNDLLKTVYKMRGGDTSARVSVNQDDEIGKLGIEFNKMADEMVDTLHEEMIGKQDLEGKIELLHDTVNNIGNGDLSAEVMAFSGSEGIDKLATGIQSMIDSLNELVSQVQQSGIQVTSSSTEIAATAKEQEATVTQQAATTTQIMATATQISATSRELASTMKEVAEVADQTTISANDGQDALSNMENTMMQMNNATASITSKLAVLSEKAANINTVVTTITKVADQTNLLSLNAAIEAEKAGEYGLGFAVVATEIRRLADQTAVATWDIEQMVKEMQSAVSAGVMGMDKFSEEVTRGVDEVRQIGGQLAQIIEEVQTLTPRFDAVNEGMQSQSHGAQQISDGMVQLNEATQQTVISLQQSSASIELLNGAAQKLQSGVSRFRTK